MIYLLNIFVIALIVVAFWAHNQANEIYRITNRRIADDGRTLFEVRNPDVSLEAIQKNRFFNGLKWFCSGLAIAIIFVEWVAQS